MPDPIDQRMMVQELMAQLGERKPISNLLSAQQQDDERARLAQGAADIRGRGLESFEGMDLETLLGSQAASQRGINESDLEELLRQQILDEEMKRQKEEGDVLREIGIEKKPLGEQAPLAPYGR